MSSIARPAVTFSLAVLAGSLAACQPSPDSDAGDASETLDGVSTGGEASVALDVARPVDAVVTDASARADASSPDVIGLTVDAGRDVIGLQVDGSPDVVGLQVDGSPDVVGLGVDAARDVTAPVDAAVDVATPVDAAVDAPVVADAAPDVVTVDAVVPADAPPDAPDAALACTDSQWHDFAAAMCVACPIELPTPFYDCDRVVPLTPDSIDRDTGTITIVVPDHVAEITDATLHVRYRTVAGGDAVMDSMFTATASGNSLVFATGATFATATSIFRASVDVTERCGTSNTYTYNIESDYSPETGLTVSGFYCGS